MYCYHCRATLGEEAVFCAKCGRAKIQKEKTQDSYRNTSSQRGKDKKIALISVISGVMFFVLIIAFNFIDFNSTPRPRGTYRDVGGATLQFSRDRVTHTFTFDGASHTMTYGYKMSELKNGAGHYLFSGTNGVSHVIVAKWSYDADNNIVHAYGRRFRHIK
jgi:hypothetical protein